jgi:2-hydroxychromene-2-carboxylate isomerase
VESGANPDQFLRKAFPGVWADERNLADEQTLVMLADGVGLPGQKLLADAKSESAKKRYEKNIKEALEVDAFGSPCYVLDGAHCASPDVTAVLSLPPKITFPGKQRPS